MCRIPIPPPIPEAPPFEGLQPPPPQIPPAPALLVNNIINGTPATPGPAAPARRRWTVVLDTFDLDSGLYQWNARNSPTFETLLSDAANNPGRSDQQRNDMMQRLKTCMMQRSLGDTDAVNRVLGFTTVRQFCARAPCADQLDQ